ncbi:MULTISPECIES: glycosyltransferase [unclassified Isoptericola]|uniref:glycosyltransferase n=1 Tax=unclassified Isoptericola TaxID=2623355 RepID=UPI003647B07D
MPPSRPGPRTSLPPGSHAAATWTIPADYGGMTSAMLRRSRSFVQEAGVPVRILTFAPDLDVDAVRASLESRGELIDGTTLHNVWHDVCRLPDDALGVPRRARPARVPAAAPGERVRTEGGGDGPGPGDGEGDGEDDETGRVLHFRPDGSLAAVEERSRVGRRAVTLYARDGRRGRRLPSVWALYRSWLEDVLPAGPRFVVVDSKTMVPFFAAGGCRDLRTVHVVHGAHLAADAVDAHGPLTTARAPLVEHLDDFDAVVFLTDAQRRDVLDRVGERAHTVVVPNGTDLPDGPVPAHADRYRGAVVASLVLRKRVGHAVTATGRAARRTGLGLTLDVYGDGPRRAAVEARAATVPGVTLHGFVPGAADRLSAASYLLVTSRSEGLPLVFAEAMARGCVPISYDIRYGPSDIVTDGVDGFLVPDGDVDALAAAIERFVTLDDAAVRRMREAAVATARGYSDAAVVARWAEVLHDVARRPGPARRLPVVRHVAGMLRRAPH